MNRDKGKRIEDLMKKNPVVSKFKVRETSRWHDCLFVPKAYEMTPPKITQLFINVWGM